LSFLDPKRKIYCDPGAHPGMVLRCPGVNARRWVIADWIPCVPMIAHGDKGGRMFKSILIPTDGSKLSDQAALERAATRSRDSGDMRARSSENFLAI
jgi:hypothetical protein